ncbi:MAG: NAD(P)-dependent oxidoreductase [SAR202 cluster bacterium]|nr:NAD(P)-dependent oxidoreductase [SAR202 cluster bacterium]
MKNITVGIISPGDMGHAVGAQLINNNVNVITSLEGRSKRTKSLAKYAKIQDVGNLKNLVENSDLILSILVPSQAVPFAKTISETIKSLDKSIYFADCNAIAPQTTQKMSEYFNGTSAIFIDGGIIGGPPSENYQPVFYTSGPDTTPLESLNGKGIKVNNIGSEIGQASAIKMCYAGMTKGTIALNISVLSTAKILGVYDSLIAEFSKSQSEMLKRMNGMSEVHTKSNRWIGEMLEISSTFESANLSGMFHKAAADTYDFVSKTEIALNETPENYKEDRSLEELIDIFSKYLQE